MKGHNDTLNVVHTVIDIVIRSDTLPEKPAPSLSLAAQIRINFGVVNIVEPATLTAQRAESNAFHRDVHQPSSVTDVYAALSHWHHVGIEHRFLSEG